MKSLRLTSLMFMILSAAVFIKYAPIREVFVRKPMYAFGIFVIASLIHLVAMEE